jgi:hypothetical protein
MLNPFKEVNWRPGCAERKTFARSLMIGFPIIAVVLAVAARFGTHEWKAFFLWLGSVGFFAGLLFWLIPQIARPFYIVWYAIACCIGLVVGNVLLGMVYYLVLTPVGLLLRAAGRPPISKGFDRKRTSYWKPAEKVIDLKRYYRQF